MIDLDMIYFAGITMLDKVAYIRFVNSDDQKVDVPIDKVTADRITKYLGKIMQPSSSLSITEDAE